MAKTDTKPRQAEQTIVEQPQSRGELVAAGSMKLRLPYPKSLETSSGITPRDWQVLIDAIWPSARTMESVCLAIAYCKSRNLDPMKRPIHIVPVWSKTAGPDGKGGEIETIWPGISELRTTAVRTGVYAGKDAAVFGPDITKTFQHIDDRNDAVKEEKTLTFPEWCQVTVFRMVQGQRCAFVGPKVYWLEAYASKSKFNDIPNDMWADRRSGQVEKCAEAASLRAAFPEELGNEYTAEEMYGRTIDGNPGQAESRFATPPRPVRSDFERDTTRHAAEEHHGSATPQPQAKAETAKAEPDAASPAKETAPASEPETAKPAQSDAPALADEETPEQKAAWLEEMKTCLANQTRASEMAELRDVVTAELSGQALKEWIGLCDTKLRAILEASRVQKPRGSK